MITHEDFHTKLQISPLHILVPLFDKLIYYYVQICLLLLNLTQNVVVIANGLQHCHYGANSLE